MRADLGITGDAITAVGDLERVPAGRIIDAAGLMSVGNISSLRRRWLRPWAPSTWPRQRDVIAHYRTLEP